MDAISSIDPVVIAKLHSEIASRMSRRRVDRSMVVSLIMIGATRMFDRIRADIVLLKTSSDAFPRREWHPGRQDYGMEIPLRIHVWWCLFCPSRPENGRLSNEISSS